MRRTISAALQVAAIVLALAVLPSAASAQFGGVPGSGIVRGFSPQIGVRAGWLFKDQSPSIGAVLIVPIPIPLLRPTLVGGADAIFQDGLRERLLTADLQINALPGLFVGGGPAVMNTYFDTSITRETKTGFSAVVGVRARGGRMSNSLELRKIRVGSRHPTVLFFSLSYPIFSLIGI
jgi:hypothetical protein